MGTHRAGDAGGYAGVQAGTEWTGLPRFDGYPDPPAGPDVEAVAALDPREWTRDVDIFYGSLLAVVVAAFVGLILYAVLTA